MKTIAVTTRYVLNAKMIEEASLSDWSRILERTISFVSYEEVAADLVTCMQVGDYTEYLIVSTTDSVTMED